MEKQFDHIVISQQGNRIFINVSRDYSYFELIGVLSECIRCVEDFADETITPETNLFQIEINSEDVYLSLQKGKTED
jgi:hypothetical protein